MIKKKVFIFKKFTHNLVQSNFDIFANYIQAKIVIIRNKFKFYKALKCCGYVAG